MKFAAGLGSLLLDKSRKFHGRQWNICKVIQYYKSEPASAQDAADAGSLWKYCITWPIFHCRPWNFPDLFRGMLPEAAANFIKKFQILVKLFKINSWRYNKWWFWLAFWNSPMKHLITSEIFHVGQWHFPYVCRKHLTKCPENFAKLVQ